MKVTITYEWHRRDNKPIDIEESEAAMLADEAEERIFKLRGEGYTSGLLVSVTITDEGNETEYAGSWSVKES